VKKRVEVQTMTMGQHPGPRQPRPPQADDDVIEGSYTRDTDGPSGWTRH
jgi:hypothetical protein